MAKCGMISPYMLLPTYLFLSENGDRKETILLLLVTCFRQTKMGAIRLLLLLSKLLSRGNLTPLHTTRYHSFHV